MLIKYVLFYYYFYFTIKTVILFPHYTRYITRVFIYDCQIQIIMNNYINFTPNKGNNLIYYYLLAVD